MEAAEPDRPEGRGRSRWLWLAPLFLLITLTAAGAAYAAWLGPDIPRGTSVEGVDVGGLTSNAAVARLSSVLDELNGPIKISARDGEQAHAIVLGPRRHGISIDTQATVDALPVRQFNPVWLVRHLVVGRSHHAVVRVDADTLATGLQGLAAKVTTTPVEGDITFTGITPVAVEPAPGTRLDVEGLASSIADNWLRGAREFTVEVVQAQPRVQTGEVRRVMEAFARIAVSGPVTLHVDGNPIVVNPTVIAQSLRFYPDEQGSLEPHLLVDLFTDALSSQWARLTVPAQNASFKSVGGKVRVIPSVKGREVPPLVLEQAMLAALVRSGEDRVAFVATAEVDAPLTTQDAIDLDLREQIGYFQTQFPWTSYRAHNIHRAADILNGTIVAPGEVFSLNGVIGQRTAANGFVEGVVISGGRLAKEFGGGVSQIATTVWNAAWFAGLELLQHKPHSFYISRYPVGRESTVSWPDVDVKFRNDTGKPIVITTSYYSNYISIAIYGTRKYDVETITGPRVNPTTFKSYEDDSSTCINQDGIAGFTIEVTRILKQEGVEVGRRVYTTRYRAEDRVRCTNPEATFGNAPIPTTKPKPRPKPTVSPSPSETATPDPNPGS